MGILNVTPDSFYDGGKHIAPDEIIAKVQTMVDEGVDIIDIGGQSTKPGTSSIGVNEELERVLPAINLLRNHFPKLPISIDTYHSEVAMQAVNMGAAMINDVSGGSIDPKMFETIAQLKVPYVLMHMQGKPENMQHKPEYHNVVREVAYWFSQKINQLKALGVNDIVLDLGFGFGKTQNHNYELLAGMKHFQLFDLPILTGISRKSMIWKALNTSANEALNGTTALHLLALQNGSSILRAHDVKAAKEAIQLFELYKKAENRL